MDNLSLYGETVYRMGFAEAARAKLIVPFQVVGSFVQEDDLSREDLVASNTAKWIALRKAMREVGARKAITFHTLVRDASDFAGVIDGVPSFHVNGEQSSEEREGILAAFAAAPEGVLTNARCLTEGVDVPSVDMVAFMDPRHGLTDIVQAAGRALRRAPDKSMGYVFVPLNVEVAKGETAEEAIRRADFSQVIHVLRSLTENDDGDTPWTSRLCRAFEPDEERPPLLRLLACDQHALDRDRLEAALRARVIDLAAGGFEAWFERLVAYHADHGDCDVPREGFGGLGRWVNRQREFARREGYPQAYRHRLDELGFCWDPRAARDDAQEARLVQFAADHGHFNVPKKFPGELYRWVRMQRRLHALPSYDAARKARLSALGFEWSPPDNESRSDYNARREAELAEFRATHGHCEVPADDPTGLGAWVAGQRKAAKEPWYPGDRRARLAALGFCWDHRAERDERMVEALAEFQRIHGHLRVPKGDPSGLNGWIRNQRVSARQPGYSEGRRAQLSAMGFDWNPIASHSAAMEAELAAYHRTHGNCDVSKDHPGGLHVWLRNQRRLAKSPHYPADRRERLTAMGFRWSPDRLEAPGPAPETAAPPATETAVIVSLEDAWLGAGRLAIRPFAGNRTIRRLEPLGRPPGKAKPQLGATA